MTPNSAPQHRTSSPAPAADYANGRADGLTTDRAVDPTAGSVSVDGTATQPTPLGIVPFSRRTFFSASAAVGALTFLGSFLGGRGLAFADDEGAVHFVIYVLSREEVPVLALDVSSSTPTPVQNVTVTIKSQLNGEFVTVTTDENGFAPANVRPLSYQRDNDAARVYNCWASIESSCEGYRTFAVGDYFVEAGTPTDSEGNRPNTIQIPTQPLNGQPYLRTLTLDGADIQYTANLQAEVWDGNTMEHELVAEVVTPEPDQAITVTVLLNGEAYDTQTVTSGSDEPYLARATFTRAWLREISVGDTLSVSFGNDELGTWTFKSPLTFAAPVLMQSSEEQGYQQDVPLSPGIQATDDPTESFCPIPGFLNREGDSMCVSIPVVPIQLFFDTKGRFGFSATLLQIDYVKRHNGEDIMDKTKTYQTFLGLSGEKAWTKYKESFNEHMQDFEDTYDGFGEDGNLGTTKATTDINVNFLLDAMGIGTVETLASQEGEPNHFTADVAVRPSFNANASYTLQINAGGIPLVIGFDGSFYLKAEFAFGAQFDDLFKNVKFHYYVGDGTPFYSVVVKMRLEFGVSLGVGISGVASISMREYAYLNGEFTFQQVENKPAPHNVIKIGADAEVTIQVLFFKKSYSITHNDPKILCDNWEGTQATLEDAFEEFPSFDATDMELVRDSDLTTGTEVNGYWPETNDKTDALCPVYDTLTANLANVDLTRPRAADLLNDTRPSLSAVNGLVPITQMLLYQDCFSNPRLRIIHTDAKSFTQDRAFMVRVLTTQIEVPGTTDAFAANTNYFQGEAFDETDLAVDEVDGNYYLKPASLATHPANATTLPRTRIAVCEWDADARTWGGAHTIDFTVPGEILALDRLNSHDVDFDVDFYDGKLIIAITSLQRPEGSTDLSDYESKQYLSVVRYDIDQQKVVAAGSTFSLINNGMSLFHPHILMQQFDTGDGQPSDHCVVYSYACNYDSSGARSDAYLAATVFDDLADGFEGHRISTPTIIACDALASLSPDTLVTGSFEVACPDRSATTWDAESRRYQTTVLIAWSHGKSERMSTARSMVFLQTYSIVIEDKGGVRTFEPHVNERDSLMLAGVPTVAKLGRMNQQALLSYSDITQPTNQKPLKMVTFDPDNMELGLLEDTGLSDKTQYFSSFNGRRLYCVRTIDGTAPGSESDAVGVASDGGHVCDCDGPYNTPAGALSTESSDAQLYQLLEARWVDGIESYFDFYPIAQVDYIPDNIGVIAANANYTHFTFATVTDIDRNISSIYQVDVPVVLSATLSDARPVSPFAAAGDTCWYTCEIANVGNAPITSVTMRVAANGAEVATTTYDDLAAYMRSAPEDAHARYGDDGKTLTTESGLVASTVERDPLTLAGILWPGRRRAFRFGFTVPEGLEGDVTFDITVAAVADHMDDDTRFGTLTAAANDGCSIPFMAADDYVLAEPVFASAPLLSTTPVEMDLSLQGDTFASDFDVSAANYTQTGADAGGAGTSGADSSASSGLAKTGDNLAALAALVAAGAGAAAAHKLHAQARGQEGDEE